MLFRSAAKPALPPEPVNPIQSAARDLKTYRQDAARHLYKTHGEKIYRGKLPSMLMAVGVVNVVVGPQGQVQDIVWSRAPDHVPEVKREIETLIKQAGPFPAPVHLRNVVYTETWLWHKSGKFQLDTLTEGQQ